MTTVRTRSELDRFVRRGAGNLRWGMVIRSQAAFVRTKEQRERAEDLSPVLRRLARRMTMPEIYTRPDRLPGYLKHQRIRVLRDSVRNDSTRPFPPEFTAEEHECWRLAISDYIHTGALLR